MVSLAYFSLPNAGNGNVCSFMGQKEAFAPGWIGSERLPQDPWIFAVWMCTVARMFKASCSKTWASCLLEVQPCWTSEICCLIRMDLETAVCLAAFLKVDGPWCQAGLKMKCRRLNLTPCKDDVFIPKEGIDCMVWVGVSTPEHTLPTDAISRRIVHRGWVIW